MICEICSQDSDQVTECKHPKNAYCALYQKQAIADHLLYRPKKYRTLAQLEVGDVFRYKGSEEDDWHTVSKVDEQKIYYAGLQADKPQSNWRTDNVLVICKSI